MSAPWLVPRDTLPGREGLVAEVLAQLEARPMVVLSGPAGIGKTAIAATAASHCGRPVVGVDLTGCENADDAVRAFGVALGSVPAGDEGALLDRLRRRGPLVVVADPVETDAVLDRLGRFASSAPELRVLATSELGAGAGALAVPPLPSAVLLALAGGTGHGDLEGSPLLAGLVEATGLPVDEALARVQAALGPLAAYPTGLPVRAPPGLPEVALRPDANGWTVPARGILDRVGVPIDAAAGAAALAAVDPGPLASAADADGLADPRRVLLLRQLARTLPDELDAARCGAAAARWMVATGQVESARRLLAELRRRTAADRPTAWLDWADADALFAAGDVDSAQALARQAVNRFDASGDGVLAARATRRTADRLAVRGLARSAGRWYRDARVRSQRAGDGFGRAAAVRGTAALAVARGEWLAAEALLDEVDADIPAMERANRALVHAALAIGQGDLDAADRQLAAVAPVAGPATLARANLVRRRADVLLRQGQYDAASLAAREAAALYARLGEVGAQGAAVRLQADLLALRGQAGRALATYARAMALLVRAQDLPGLGRTLEHAAEVAEAAGLVAEARQRREQHAAVWAALDEG